MISRCLKFPLVALICAATACSQSETKPVADAYVTNAEYVLERLELAKSSGVAFQVKPIRKTACKHMYIEIGKQNAEGRWESTNVAYPGKDNRNSFGQTDLKDQVHFVEVDGVGEYGVVALGCEPYGGNMQVVRNLLSTFKVEPGKLNYIGEIALVPVGSEARGFFTAEVMDRSDFAMGQIQLQLPEMDTYFYPNIMEKYVVEVSPQERAKLDRLAAKLKGIKKESDKRTKNANLIIPKRNLLSKELKKANEALDLWDAQNGYPQQDQSDKQIAERRALRRTSGRLIIKIRRYDDWIDGDVPFPITEKYMKLEAAADRARRNQDAKFPSKIGATLSRDLIRDPDYLALSEARSDANEALRAFAERHGL